MRYSRRVFIWMSFALEVSLVIGICLYGLFRKDYIVHAYGPVQLVEADSVSTQEEEIITDSDLARNGKGGPYIMAPALRYSTYHVKRGENISTIAKKNRLDLYTLLTINHLKQANEVSVGQKIKLPNQRGIMHTVGTGETIEDIALTYKASVRKIIRVNRILDPSKIKKGVNLFIPGAMVSVELSKQILKSSGINFEEFIWPCGKATRMGSGYGYRRDPFHGRRAFHYGADLSSGYGANVYASRDGIVTYAGWMGGYGKLIVIQHSDGYSTRYGHLSRILVSKGQRVRQSHKIGAVGSTGRSTGPHLHFEIRQEGRAMNPRKLLGR